MHLGVKAVPVLDLTCVEYPGRELIDAYLCSYFFVNPGKRSVNEKMGRSRVSTKITYLAGVSLRHKPIDSIFPAA